MGIVKSVKERTTGKVKGPRLSAEAPWRMDERLVRCLSK
jgi:hypothetical protein